LRSTDIFSSVEVEIAKPRDPLAAHTDVDLVFKTKEKGRISLSSTTELGNNEGSAVRIEFDFCLFADEQLNVVGLLAYPQRFWRSRDL
jgi:hypothetical protein